MGEARASASDRVKHLPLALERDGFLRTLLGHLAGALEEIVGLDEAAGFVSVVGQRVGDELDASYRAALGTAKLSRAEVAAVLVDLKRRIRGDFYLIEETRERVVLGNRACPFGDKVLGRPSLCMMTSNVFGVVAAENLGWAKVVIERSIARGDSECRVTVHLEPIEDALAADGREYVGS